MINKSEIIKLALAQKVRSSTIDKDWVLGHLLDAIYTLPTTTGAKSLANKH